MKKATINLTLMIVILVLIVLAVAGMAYFYTSSQREVKTDNVVFFNTNILTTQLVTF